MSRPDRTPRWVWVAMILLAGIAPLTHIWIGYFPPAGTVPTGFHIGDDSVFLPCMRMFETHFHTPYATCKSGHGDHYFGYFPLPYLWMYGVVGAVGRLFGFDGFIFLGFANGLGALVFLWAVYRLLREIVPRQADRAFLLFAVSGGLGGVLYVLSGVFGLDHAPAFEEYFKRYALMELIEGPFLLPNTFTPRLYYVLPLALCTSALVLFIKAARRNSRWRFLFFTAPLFLGTWLNFRVGTFTLAVAALYLCEQVNHPLSKRIRLAALFVLPVLAGWVAAWCVILMSPTLAGNQLTTGNVAMWVTPFLSVAVFHLVIVPREVAVGLRGLSRLGRFCALTLIGYLSAFAILFCAYQINRGNILVARDGAVASAISDWSLIGAVLGAIYACVRRRPTSRETNRHGWIILWFLSFLAISISAFGHGWFLCLGPQRMSIMLWLPICVLSASGLERLEATRPRLARSLTGVMVSCGIVSIAVASLYFQGPLGYRFGPGPFAEIHNEVMNDADATVMDHIDEGTVLAPIPASDVIAYNRGNSVVFGLGTYNLSAQPYVELESGVNRFFAGKASQEYRLDFVREWCVDYVYCPDTWPVAKETIEQLRQTPWLQEVAAEGRAVLFKVVMQ